MSYNVEKHAQVIVNYCLELKDGDLLMISGPAIAEPLFRWVKIEATKIGAQVLPMVFFEGEGEDFYEYASDELLQRPNKVFEMIAEKIDAYLNIGGGYNTKSMSAIDPSKISMSNKADAKSNEIFFRRMGEGKLKILMTEYPTSSHAQEGNMGTRQYNDFVGDAMLLGEEDSLKAWKIVHDEQQVYCDYLNNVEELHIISEDTDLTMSVKGRKWINCDGKINLPDGEVFTGPIENSVNGKIRFSYPGIFMGKEIKDIRLEFKDGKVIQAQAEVGNELLQSLLETDDGSRFVGEVAIGTNYGIQTFTKNMLFDEKMGGTLHLALGASIPESGGLNVSTIHWDLLCNMKNGGLVVADGKVIYEDGKWLI